MKKLEVLKKELLDGKLDKFYVFYGEDFGIRRHYIEKIKSFFSNKVIYAENCKGVQFGGKTKSLFGTGKQLVIVYNDEDFARETEKYINKFIDGLVNHVCIVIYETALENSTLFKSFENYITYFPVVQKNIAKEFVDSELHLITEDAESLAMNCSNNYNNILLESDKIKNFAQAKNITEQNSYEALDLKNQLLEEPEDFDSYKFMNDVISGNAHKMGIWYKRAKANPDKVFMSLTSIFNDFLIAGLIVRYGDSDGGSRAFNYKLSWNRVKTLREIQINFPSDYLFNCAYNVACIDNDVKSGRLDRNDIIDYFFSSVL